MNHQLSTNTQAILLLTAPLFTGRRQEAGDLLSLGEYAKLAQQLRSLQRQPADLLTADASALLQECAHLVDAGRLERLLGRGFQLSQAVERWQSRAIWVTSRADAAFPRRLKARMRDAAPPILYGCGDARLFDAGGLAVVGSRHADEALLAYTEAIGRLVSASGRAVVSGGARGVDQAAVRGALKAGGVAVAILADSLEKAAVHRDYRRAIMDGQLLLASPFDPGSGFNVGHAMQRNKLIYALADSALVVNADLERGGTWAGAVEQLAKLHFCPVYVRSTGAPSVGLDALTARGARRWPNPTDEHALLTLLAGEPQELAVSSLPVDTSSVATTPVDTSPVVTSPVVTSPVVTSPVAMVRETPHAVSATAADQLFSAVRVIVREYLAVPRKESEIAEALGVLPAQAKQWLQLLMQEGTIEKRKKPVCYALSEARLFE